MCKEFIIRYLKHCGKVWTEQFVRYLSQKEDCSIDDLKLHKKWFAKNKKLQVKKIKVSQAIEYEEMTELELCGEKEDPPEFDEFEPWSVCTKVNLFGRHKELEKLGLLDPLNTEESSKEAITYMEGEMFCRIEKAGEAMMP